MVRPRKQWKINPISAAVLELRKRCGLTQQSFAVALGMAINSVARYETGRVPDVQPLSRLAEFADAHGHQDLARLFRFRWMNDTGMVAASIESARASAKMALDQLLEFCETHAEVGKELSNVSYLMNSVLSTLSAFDGVSESIGPNIAERAMDPGSDIPGLRDSDITFHDPNEGEEET